MVVMMWMSVVLRLRPVNLLVGAGVDLDAADDDDHAEHAC